MKGHPLQNFKSMYLVNGYRFAKDDEVPIMSFQTDFNGTWNPTINPSVGTLKWVVDGVEQITNTPSYALTGALVDVKVFANDVPEGVIISDVNGVFIQNLNIIGAFDLSYFTLQTNVALNLNPNLNSVIFSNFNNIIGGTGEGLRVDDTGIDSLNLSNVTLTLGLFALNCPNLTSVNFGNNNHTFSRLLDFRNSPITSLQFNNSLFTSGGIDVSNTELALLDFGVNNHTFTSRLAFNNCDQLPSINIGSNLLSDCEVYIDQCRVLTSFSFGTNPLSTINRFFFDNCDELLNVDMSTLADGDNVGNQEGQTCPKLSTFTSGANSRICNFMSHRNWDDINFTNIDLSNWTFTNILAIRDCAALALINQFSVTTGISQILLTGNALNLSTVDGLLSYLNSFFTSNTPIKNITLSLNGGTNASPTGGSSNTDLQSLITIFNNAGFTLTYLIN